MRFSRMVTVVGAHAAGELNEVITGGVLDVPGRTMFEKMQYLESKADELRQFLLNEPRGRVNQCVNLILPPTHPEADAGFVIIRVGLLCADVGHQYDLHGHRVARNRDAADARAGHRTDIGGASRTGEGARGMPRRQMRERRPSTIFRRSCSHSMRRSTYRDLAASAWTSRTAG